ncbi:FGGY-family carbohydrate kinase [Streptomyces sp. NPDC058255]|uniref:FGGY-family carbohydrate kinase n=1 Tax=Streptomyces sp. NPDC058255 TaxID=3346407 RepID=UPI0036E41850
MAYDAYEGDAWLGVDLGTQSVRVLLVTAEGRVLGAGAAALTGRRDGLRHEQDPGEWWDAVGTASRAALASRPPGVRIGGLAVCGTSGTVLLTDAEGRALTPALMYDDGRAAEDAARARQAGLLVQNGWGLPKALWLLREHESARPTHRPDAPPTHGAVASLAQGVDVGPAHRADASLGHGADVGPAHRADASPGHGADAGPAHGADASLAQGADVGPAHRADAPLAHRADAGPAHRADVPPAQRADVRLAHQADVITARLTGHPTPTDSSHALKTAYDLEADSWPHAVFAELGLPEQLLPPVVRPGSRLGEVCAAAAERTGIPAGTPVIAGMTDGCAAQIASGALREGSWNAVLGTTLVLKGVSSVPVRDGTGVVYNHRAPDGSWWPGGASSVGAGALTARFPDASPAAMDRAASAHEPASVLAYPLTSPGERFPFLAPDATPFVLGSPGSDTDLWAALLQGVALTERLCLDYLHHLGAPLDGPLTFTGGAARSPYWNQLRADILGRPARVPEQTEPALGMAALAAYGTGAAPTLADAADRMVRIRGVLEPRPARTALFADPYARWVAELERRGWLPAPVAAHARARLNLDTAGS